MYIYIIENKINGKVYIGKTKYKNANNRWSAHKSSAMKKPIHPIARAIAKYGPENFSFIPFQYCNNNEELNQEEIYWIAQMRESLGRNMVYNIFDGGGKDSPNKGKKLTEEWKKKISDTMKKNPNTGIFLKGHPVSDKVREAVSNSNKNREIWNKGTKGITKANSGSFKPKINQNIANQIRREYSADNISYSKLSRKYNISAGLVGLIINNKIWSTL
jgi:group I intron endonuclease